MTRCTFLARPPRTRPSSKKPTGSWVDRARTLAARIAPFAADHDRDGTFVHEAFDLLRLEGFVGAPVPTEFGGGGASHVETGTILTELAKGCPATAVTLSMHYHLVATQVWRHNHGQPAEAVLRKVGGDHVVLVSTGAADWVDSTGSARKVDGGFRITARKTPSSGAPAGTILVTSAPWADDPDGPSVIHCAVPFSAEGVSIDPTWDSMGLRGTGSDTVVLDDVFVPDESVSLIRQANEWHPVWNAVLGSAMPLIMAAYLGIGEAPADIALGQTRARSNNGSGDVPAHLLPVVGDMINQLTAAQDLVAAMFAASDDLHFAPTVAHASAILARKTMAAEALIATVRAALDVCGGVGFSRPAGLERLYRDAHGALYHPLPAAKQQPFTARVTLGLDPLG